MSLGVDAKWIEVSGLKTRYFEAGTGSPVMLITGGHFGNPTATSTVETWEHNFPAISRAHRVIAVEKLGQGQTDNPPADDYTMQAVVAHLAAFMDAMALDGVHVVGQSAGALPAVALVRERPSRVRSCTVINSSTLSPGVGMTEVNLAGCPHPSYTRESQRWVMERSAFDPASVTDNFVESGYEVMCSPRYREAVAKMQGGAKDALFVPRLAALKADLLNWMMSGGLSRPTQVVWGANDRTAGIERGVELFDMLSRHERRCSMHVFNAAGHHPYREHPAHFNEVLLRFTAAVDRESGGR